MRLGQLARKYDVSSQQIIDYLQETAPELTGLHPNTKLEAKTEELLAERFYTESPDEADSQTHDEIVSEPETTPVEIPDEAISLVNEESAEEKEVVLHGDEAQEDVIELPEPSEPKIEKSIETDRLLEILESEEIPEDLEEITLIKAPKKELDGLKVVGKIELKDPEPKSKDEEPDDISTDDSDGKKKRTAKKGKSNGRLSAEEIEQRRKRAKKKKEDFLKRQERRRKHKEEEERKARRKAYYEQKIQQAKSKQIAKKKSKPVQAETLKKEKPKKPEPKTLFGKVIRWLVDAS